MFALLQHGEAPRSDRQAPHALKADNSQKHIPFGKRNKPPKCRIFGNKLKLSGKYAAPEMIAFT